MTMNAANSNAKVLKSHHHDLEKNNQRPPRFSDCVWVGISTDSSLEYLYGHHKNWQLMMAQIRDGCKYPIRDMPTKELYHDIEYMMKRGNHQSTWIPETYVVDNIRHEIELG